METKLTTVTINTKEIPIKEYQGQRVVTLKEIDAVHKRPEGTARRRFNENRKRFVEDVDFFVLNQPSEIRTLGLTRPQGGTPDKVTLMTESGYLLLVKSFNDDLAWKVQRQLVNSYFRARQEQSQATGLDMTAVTQIVTIVATEMVKQLVPIVQSIHQAPTLPPASASYTPLWRSNYHPGPRKKVVAERPSNGMLKIECFPAELRQEVDEMMVQMLAQNTLNFCEIARYCTDRGCMISSPSGRSMSIFPGTWG